MPHKDTRIGYLSSSSLTLNATQGHKHWLLIQPLIDLYPRRRNDLNLYVSTKPNYSQSGVLIISNFYLRFIGYKLKLIIDIITIPTSHTYMT